VDILNSSSRVMVDVATEQHLKLAQIYRRTLATYREAEDLINIGAYVQGSNPEIDYALSKNTQMQDYALQDMQEHTSLTECEARLLHIFGDRMTGTT
jgi:flagellum-specific ATP synthase